MTGRKKLAQDQAPGEDKANKPAAVKQAPAKKVHITTPKVQPSAAPTVYEDGDPLCGLTPQEAMVVDRYLATYNQAQAYIEAGYQAKNLNTAKACASRLLTSANSRRYRAKRIRELMARNEDAQDRLLALFVDMAYTDARELSEMRVGCCRYCHGTGHLYQFTPQEFEQHEAEHDQAVAKAVMERGNPPEFNPLGGMGFRRSREPHPECPECDGEGKPRVVFKDTQGLSPGAVTLYAGAKIGKDGIEVKQYDQKAARETLAKILKLYDDRSVVEVKFDPAELEARFGARMRAAHEAAAKMRAERLADRDSREA